MKETFDITGMTCAACSARVGKAASAVPGVEEANVNLLKNSMELVYDGTDATCDAVIAAIEKAGYGAAPRAPHGGQAVSASSASACSLCRATSSRSPSMSPARSSRASRCAC